jgi:putative heme-binding domain-containing protein
VNNTFTGDAGGQLVHRKLIVPDGVSVKGMRPPDEQGFEFAASKDTWVRVVNFANAPDGCLHICDMYREVIEHPWSIPDEIKKHIDLNSGNERGRIYRIVPDSTDWKRRGTVDLSKATTEELVATLDHDNGWHRDCAARLLYERNDKAAVPLLEKKALFSQKPLSRLHSLHALAGLDALTETVLIKAMEDKDPGVREHAVLLSERIIKDGKPSEPLWAKFKSLSSSDWEPRVRMQLAFTLGGLERSYAVRGLVSLRTIDPWVMSAIVASPPEFSAEVYRGKSGMKAGLNESLTQKLWYVIGARNDPAEVASIIARISAWQHPDRDLLDSFASGLRRAGSSLAKADTAQGLDAMFIRAAATAMDGNTPIESRLRSITVLGLANFNQAHPVLRSCLGKDLPDRIQAAAVSALGTFKSDEVTRDLLEHWPTLADKARAAALTALLARDDRTKPLLEAVQSGRIAASALSASQVQSLIKHEDKSIAALAKTALVSVIPPSREEVLAKFQPALAAKGDFARGQMVFLQRCLACHRAAGQGIQVGPDLVTVKTKGKEALLTAVLDPHKEVAPQYIAYTVNTKDGQTLAGIVTKDDASSMTLQIMGGVEMNLPRSNIKGSTSSGQSLMPEGLEAGMTVQDMAVLLEFIEKAN